MRSRAPRAPGGVGESGLIVRRKSFQSSALFLGGLLLTLCALLSPARAWADEDFCSDIPSRKVKFDYRPEGENVALTLAVPRQYRDAEFHYAQVQIGDDEEDFLRFDLAMKQSAQGKYSATVELPRDHALLRFKAIYFGKKCARELNAIFKNAKPIH